MKKTEATATTKPKTMATEPKTKAKATTATDAVTRSTTLMEIVERHPETISVLFSYGLQCIGCHFAATETLEQGCLSHGMTEKDVESLLKDVNRAIDEAANRPLITLTDEAATTIKDVMKATNKTGGLRVIALEGGENGTTYDLTIEAAQNKDDVVLENKGVKIYVDKESLKRCKGCTIDYLEHKQGFAVRRN